MCTFAMNESLTGILERQLSSSAQSTDDLLSEFDLEQTADLLAVSEFRDWLEIRRLLTIVYREHIMADKLVGMRAHCAVKIGVGLLLDSCL